MSTTLRLRSGQVLLRYWHTNGRPSRMQLASTGSDLQYLNSYVNWYLQYNWHAVASTVADMNSNGDGWNNVSPFGDNGNGAYPANPNLEQYYGWGGAWGYLYFNGVLGGTNTVRNVDLFISMDGGGIRTWASFSHPMRRAIICLAVMGRIP